MDPDRLDSSEAGVVEPQAPPLLLNRGTGEVFVRATSEALVPDAPAPRFAGFWRRAAAIVIDYGILLGAVFAVLVVIAGIQAAAGSKPSVGDSIPNVFGVLLFWLYFAGMESSKYQATLGKRAIGIRVTDLHGRRIDFARASGRHFAKILSTILLLTGFAMAAFTRRKQALHDVMAACLVVRGRSGNASMPEHEMWANRHWGDAPSRSTDGS